MTVGVSVPEPGIVTKTDEMPVIVNVVVVVGSSDCVAFPLRSVRVAMVLLSWKFVLGNTGLPDIGVVVADSPGIITSEACVDASLADDGRIGGMFPPRRV